MPHEETFREAVIRLRRAPTRQQLELLRDALAPGGQIGRVRRLPGGLQCGMHAVDLLTEHGDRLRLVIRRYTPQQAAGDPGVCRREWKTLGLLEEGGAPAPRPVFLDEEGATFGTPTLVISRLPGRAFVSVPEGIDPWIRQMATALAAIHSAGVGGPAAEHLRRFTGAGMAGRLLDGEETERRVAALPRGRDVLRTLREHWPPAPAAAPVLIHGDFCTGNTVWRHDRLSGVVDWGDALVGPREVDLSSARLDLTLLAGPDAADRFLENYEEIAKCPVQNIALWELTGVWGGALLLDLWWDSLKDVGASISRAELGERFEAFALRALARLG